MRRLRTDHIDLYQMPHVDRATPWEEIWEAMEQLRHLGVGLIPYSPLHAGVLAGALEAGSDDDRVEAHGHQLEAYEGLCRELGARPEAVAVAWLLRNPVVSTTLVGAMTIEELRSDLAALSVQLDDEVMQRFDRIWPGPGEAPQAYAW